MADFRKPKRKKICHMCAGKSVDYKDVAIISKYINDNGKILPRRFTGTCAKHQRHVAEQVKLARHMAFIPFVK
ncbi:MAG: 30S ribosomal protein S18 [Bacilli bacterium]|nr:30S ribosomal protein S18 [Bacilli bacterium]